MTNHSMARVLKHFLYMMWMWDALHGSLEPQSCHNTITLSQPLKIALLSLVVYTHQVSVIYSYHRWT
jgi:hypothetical protein